MSEDSFVCTCWPIQTESGAVRPLGWIDLHEQVAVTTRDGHFIVGCANGAANTNDSIDEYEVQVEGTQFAMFVPRDDILTITPTDGFDEIGPLLQALRETLCEPEVLERAAGSTYFRYVLGDHEAVDITVDYVHGQCSPRPLDLRRPSNNDGGVPGDD